jgi:lysozyme
MLLNLSLIFTLIVHSFSGNYDRIFKEYELHGIDVSHHQNHINWNQVGSNNRFKVHFAFMKATEGSTLRDTKFSYNWGKANEAGLTRGAYHFYSSTTSASLQAKNFIRTVNLKPGDLAPVLDFEVDDDKISISTVRKNLQKWIGMVERHYGKNVIIYTNANLYQKYIKGHFKNNPLWIADYNHNKIYNLMGHRNLKFWQFTESGRVGGIRGHVDVNAFLGSQNEFEKLKINEPEIEIEIQAIENTTS